MPVLVSVNQKVKPKEQITC